MTAGSLLVLLAGLLHVSEAQIPPSFAEQLRCPFAKVWLEHGPEKASEILGVAPHASADVQRRLSSTWGTCSYSVFGSPVCMELRGSSWDDASAAARCSNAFQGTAGTLAKDATCQLTADLAGWCSTSGGAEMTPMDISATSSTCDAVAQSCETWSQGAFTLAGQCAPAGNDAQSPTPAPASGQDGSAWSGGSGGAPQRCAIAPGAIGAAHQLAQSPGYDSDCQGTPAQQSPFMWPLRWSAIVEQKGLAFGSDVPTYESRGRVWYMLDRNWKRLDTWYQHGVQRTVGQRPCETPLEGTDLACNRTSTKNTTMLHRNNKMVFIDWAADGSIENCMWMDLAIIGNVRPDWFMDDRGSSTDVQYLGDSHVYYLGKPRLVKQWRKKDFANQYFTMSMQRLPGPDGIHWPLILNIPGEGFGDDFLQHWHGHRVLDESEESHFLLDEAHVAGGGSCPQSGSSGSAGPPTGQVEHVPSNLEVDQAAWITKVYTASPIWTPPAPSDDGGDSSGLSQSVSAGVQVEACFDGAASHLRFSLTLDLAAPAWAAVGFRGTDECLMTPRGGGDGEIVFAQPDAAAAYQLLYGPLSPDTKHFEDAALSGFLQRLSPVGEAAGFSSNLAEYRNGQLVLGFTRSYDATPTTFNLTYAYGRDQQVGYHASRGCFTITPVACPSVC
mmetsp:Transcript_5501/g.15906  ORF Transcript_5501/g.15906 Transcript_5501/m.15906 type:complete len:668 (-) Transcript_5501:427-2430(-)